MDLGLNGRVAFVTGASTGIGKAIAQGLARAGVHLANMARGAEARRQTAAKLCTQQGVGARPVAADIRDADSVKEAAAAAAKEFGTIHIVVNNAGGPIKRQDRQITWPDVDWLDDLNLKTVGMLRVTQ